jgi:hypothetical protein
MSAAPNLEIDIGEENRLLVGDAEDVEIVEPRQGLMVVDRIRDGRVVVAGQQHHRQRRRRNEGGGPLEQDGRHAMTIESVAGKHHDVRACGAGRTQHAGKPSRAVASMQPCSVVMIHMQVGAVNDHDVPCWQHGRPT